MKKVISAIYGILCFIMAMSGIILLMCETSDFKMQINSLVVGAVLFVLGIMPVIIKSLRKAE